MKLLPLLAIFAGEVIAIFLEIYLAHRFETQGSFGEVARAVVFLLPVAALGVGLLLLGYIYGIRSLRQIWLVTVISWSSIVLIEPVLNYWFFRELPGARTVIAGFLALAAIVISIL
jgi:hypothetical protein